MAQRKGLFVVLEGVDGSGKTTQFKLLHERLKAAGYDVEVFTFPRYDKSSSHFIKKYLAGDYGDATSVSAYTASLFYALDRYEASPEVSAAINNGKIVLADRYVGSNMAHQGSKFSDAGEQRGFFIWAESLEYQLLGIPRPDASLFLRVPADIANRMLEKRGGMADSHEKDKQYLQKTVDTYDLLSALFPRDFKTIEATKDGKMLSITKINNLIWEELKSLLPEPTRQGRKTVVRLSDDRGLKKPEADTHQTSKEKLVQPLMLESISLLSSAYFSGIKNISLKSNIHWGRKPVAFYTPTALKGAALKEYKVTLNELHGKYLKLQQKLSSKFPKRADEVKQALLLATPMAALCDMEVFGQPLALDTLLSKLELSELPEAKTITEAISKEYVSSTASSTNPEAISKIIKQIVETRLPQTLPDSGESVKLLEALPRNEFDVLADTLYPYSDMPRTNISEEIDSWTYDKKAQTMAAAIRDPKVSIKERLHYRWDVIVDRLVIAEITAGGANDLFFQPPTPRFGFLMPTIVEEADAEDIYNEIFDTSLKLFSLLQAQKMEYLAAYGTLYGHKLRWQFTITAGDFIGSLAKAKNGSATAEILTEMHDKISEAHPQAASSMEKTDRPPATGKKRRPARRRKTAK